MNREYRRKYLFEFAKEKNNYKNKFYKITFYADYDDIYRIIRTVRNNAAMKYRINKILFPRSIHEISGNKFVLNTEIDLEYLIKFCNYLFEEYSYEISRYVVLKNEYEKCLFSGNYVGALKTLDCIEDENGISVWSIAKRMLLYDKVYGLEKHKRYLSEIQTQAKNNILLNTLFELESYFAEDNTSYSAYRKRLESYDEILQDNDFIRKYIDFKFNVERDYDLDEIRSALMFDSQFSLIDMYETFVLSVQLMFVEGKYKCDELVNINDFRLNNLQFIDSPYKLDKYDLEHYKLLDLYTIGKYDEYIKQCNNYLGKSPQDFQCILLLVKAYILANRKLEIEQGLIKWVYDIYSLNGNESESIQQLLSFIKEVRLTSWESKIIGFIARKTTMGQRKKMSYMSVINDINISPNIVNNDCYSGCGEKLLDCFADICPVTKQLYYFKINKGTLPDGIIDKSRITFFKADKLIEEGKNDDAFNLINNIDYSSNYFFERVLRRKIRIYGQKKDYLSLVRCVADAILEKGNLKNRIDINSILISIDCNLTNEIKMDIHYVIFVYLCNPGEYKKQRIAYSNYMEHNGYHSIEDIINNEDKTLALNEFFYKVCIQHMLKRDIILNPRGKKADEIRIEILKSLVSLDEKNRKKYNSEIAAITKQKSIKDRIKQIDQSRIFVDTENIKKDNELSLREEFNRYLMMKDMDEEIISYDIYSEDYIRDLQKIVDEINEKIKTNAVYSQKMIILKGLITIITEKFLFDEKYGLNTFLSSRIRHGYCKKQLTTVFHEYNLLSKKKRNNSEEYIINEYWDNRLPDKIQGSIKIKENLSKFTFEIEKKIEDIKRNWLSIKYREESESLLDYTMCVNRLLLIDMDNILDFNSFYDEIISLLWNYTLKYFEILKGKIQEELLDYFQKQLSKLLDGISRVDDELVKDEVNLICKNINLCKSKIGGTTKEFANVFEKRDVSYMDYTMTDLIDTCLEIVTKLNGGMSEIELSKNIDDSHIYKGENFPYFVDAVNILMNNALEHSGFSDLSQLVMSIDIEKECDDDVLNILKNEFAKKKIHINSMDFMKLSITNSLSAETNIKMLRNKVGEIFAKTKDPETVKIYSQSEGGTGLYKLYKTFQYNINTAYSFFYSIEENTFTITILFGIMNIVV